MVILLVGCLLSLHICLLDTTALPFRLLLIHTKTTAVPDFQVETLSPPFLHCTVRSKSADLLAATKPVHPPSSTTTDQLAVYFVDYGGHCSGRWSTPLLCECRAAFSCKLNFVFLQSYLEWLCVDLHSAERGFCHLCYQIPPLLPSPSHT